MVDTGMTASRFASREAFRGAYERIADAACEAMDFESCLDVGSAQGFLVDSMLRRGKDVRGVEISERAVPHMSAKAKARIHIADATVGGMGQADLVACIEVAEHIDPVRTEPLCDALAESTTRWLLFTAAGPFQRGADHINLRPKSHWLIYLHKRGLSLDLDATETFIRRIGALPEAPWIPANALVFRRA